jgi:outer membrane protein OmpA-like peptidoglycan-associated protein
MRATRPNGLKDVNVGILAGRLMVTPVTAGALSLIIGGGAGISTETNFMHSYGVDALAGVKLAITQNAALRVDGVMDWLANENWKTYKSVRVGLSLYRRPGHSTTMMAAAPAPMMMTHDDSVSAAETRRLRQRDAALAALRDSLRNAPVSVRPVTTAASLATMQAQIQFDFDKSVITDAAARILDDKVGVFRANPDMTIVMVGYTDVTGTDAYNMALGVRRAEATRAYVVGKGIAANRVLVESAGERQQVGSATGAEGEAANRRAVFRLLMAPDVVRNP